MVQKQQKQSTPAIASENMEIMDGMFSLRPVICFTKRTRVLFE